MMLLPHLLELLPDWWRAARLQVWLFSGQNPIIPMPARQLNRALPMFWEFRCEGSQRQKTRRQSLGETSATFCDNEAPTSPRPR
jgi:hypothetical protein